VRRDGYGDLAKVGVKVEIDCCDVCGQLEAAWEIMVRGACSLIRGSMIRVHAVDERWRHTPSEVDCT
jgi:hypothetical protein